MKFRFAVLIIAALSISFANAQTAQDLFDKCIKAYGGEKLEGIKTLKITGKNIQSHPQMGEMTASFEFYFKAPNMMKGVTEQQGMKIIYATDGEKVWTIDPRMGKSKVEMQSPKKEGVLAQLNQNKEMFITNFDVDEEEKEKVNFEYGGVMEVDGNEYETVKIVSKEEGQTDKTWILFDPITSYMKGMKMETQGQEVIVHMKKQKKVDGVIFPGEISVDTPQGGIKTEVDEIEVNVDIPDSEFSMD
jgi:outer membrane lipoprotein-sorting protein